VGPLLAASSMKHRLRTALAAPFALQYVSRPKPARVLHVFRDACNLIDGDGEILSVIADPDRMSPFSIAVVNPGWLNNFLEYAEADTQVYITPERIDFGSLQIEIESPAVWDSRPAWDRIRPALDSSDGLLNVVCDVLLEAMDRESLAVFVRERVELPSKSGSRWWEKAAQPIQVVLLGLESHDQDLLRKGSARLGGLGPGLTPSGDDFLAGVMHAVWALMPVETAEGLCDVVSDAACPGTSRFSAAYLKAAARGEAAANWQALLNALIGRDSHTLERAAHALIAYGHTSGKDALSGFVLGARHLLAREPGSRLSDPAE